jgi:hypothetical protein
MLHSMLDMNYLSDCFCVSKTFLKKSKFFLFFSLLQINIFLVFSDYFDVLHENDFKKIIIINYFNTFSSEKYFEKQPHSKTNFKYHD